jgi:hypothetical protein
MSAVQFGIVYFSRDVALRVLSLSSLQITNPASIPVTDWEEKPVAVLVAVR